MSRVRKCRERRWIFFYYTFFRSRASLKMKKIILCIRESARYQQQAIHNSAREREMKTTIVGEKCGCSSEWVSAGWTHFTRRQQIKLENETRVSVGSHINGQWQRETIFSMISLLAAPTHSRYPWSSDLHFMRSFNSPFLYSVDRSLRAQTRCCPKVWSVQLHKHRALSTIVCMCLWTPSMTNSDCENYTARERTQEIVETVVLYFIYLFFFHLYCMHFYFKIKINGKITDLTSSLRIKNSIFLLCFIWVISLNLNKLMKQRFYMFVWLWSRPNDESSHLSARISRSIVLWIRKCRYILSS